MGSSGSGSGSGNLETRSLLDEWRSFDKGHAGGFFDLGHPLLNRIADTFVKAAGVRIYTLSFFSPIFVYFISKIISLIFCLI